MAAGQHANIPEEPLWMHQDAAGGLHQWLHDDCGNGIPLLCQQLLQPVKSLRSGCRLAAGVGSRPAVGSGREPSGQPGGRQPDCLKRKRRKHRGESIDATDSDRPQRVAVIGLTEGDVAGAWPLPPCPGLQMVLKGDLEGGLGGRRAVAGKEHLRETRRYDLDQPPGQFHRGGVGEAEVGRVGNEAQLPADGSVEPRMAVAMDVAPHAGRAVDVAVARRIKQVDPLAPLDQQWLVLGHLGEGMPDMLPIPGFQQFLGGCYRCGCAGKAVHAGGFWRTGLWLGSSASLS